MANKKERREMKVETAIQQLKAELKSVFPNVYFSVGSVDESIFIDYIDIPGVLTPATSEVESISNKYEVIPKDGNPSSNDRFVFVKRN